MPTRSQDLTFIAAALEELETYLLSDVLYWPLHSSSRLPMLSIGGILLGMRRLQARSKSADEQTEFEDLDRQLEAIQAKWRSAWQRKVKREYLARINLWKNYLADYTQTPETQADLYPQQVQWRVILQLLLQYPSLSMEEIEFLKELDTIVKSSWISGGFILESEVEAIFPEPEYWFLHGRLKS